MLRRFLPGPRLLPLLAAWTMFGLVLIFLPELDRAWLGSGALLLLALGGELLALALAAVPECRREVAPVVPLGVWRDVTLEFSNRRRRPLRLQVFDHHPPAVEVEGLPLAWTLPPQARTRLSYRLRFMQRGIRHFAGVDLRIPGRLGLLTRQVFLPVTTDVRVYPNFAEVSKYALLASDNRLSQLGIRLRRRRGAGLEFHQLREYREGDALRQIDWKATSRLRKLISREYQDERDQQVMLLLDGGFRMRSQDGRLSHFDEALNALLLLAYVVQRQGDAVGLMSFANEERFLPPAKGHDTLARIMNAVFDLEAGSQTPDFLSVCTQLTERLRKRSLVVIITSLRDEDSAELTEACKLLGERHLVLIANLREKVLDEIDLEEPGDTDRALTTAATHLYLQEREKALNRLRHEGMLVLDTQPDKLAVGLINRYLDIKRSGRL
ncbi:MAG: hypothetical protein K0S16_527 [Moraxellaceae bacterium]|nr:hypothetical protein [Moraxellaceae bacterium]